MKTYQKLKQIIQEANPEIRIKTSFKLDQPKHITEQIESNDYIRKVDYELGLRVFERPIRLADVLLAKKDLGVDGLGGLFIRNSCNKKGNLWEFKFCKCYWNLKDDSLDNQNKETKKFLEDLLNK